MENLTRTNWCRSSVIQRLSTIQTETPSIGLAYFYCDGNYADKQRPENILGSIVSQLLVTSSMTTKILSLEDLKSLYQRHGQNSSSTARRIDMAFFLILEISRLYGQVYIVVDGLDELNYTDMDILLSVLCKLADTKSVNLLVSSRRQKDIEEAFAGKRRIEMDSKGVLKDIARHLQYMLSESTRLRTLRKELKTSIMEELLTKSGGM